jgi:hypothetical protein
MKRTRISEWPKVRVTVDPRTLERIEDVAERRALSVAAVVREALDQVYAPHRELEERFALGSSPLGNARLS